MGKLFTIAKNTFLETIRQPVYLVIILAAACLLAISPFISMYSLDDDNKLLRELSLSTLFLASLFIAIFSASNAIAEEIENKTISTVLTKPVKRPIYVLAKFLGVAAAVTLAHYLCTIIMLITSRHGIIETVNDTFDWTVVASAAFILFFTVTLTAFFNFFYDWKASSTAVVLASIFSTCAIIFLALIDRDFNFNPQNNSINAVDIFASMLLLLAAYIIVSLALAFSSRFNVLITLAACFGIFLLGLISDYAFAQAAPTNFLARIGRFLVPNLQVFWIADAIYEGTTVSMAYIATSALYAICYTAGILSIAVALFQRKQVG